MSEFLKRVSEHAKCSKGKTIRSLKYWFQSRGGLLLQQWRLWCASDNEWSLAPVGGKQPCTLTSAVTLDTNGYTLDATLSHCIRLNNPAIHMTHPWNNPVHCWIWIKDYMLRCFLPFLCEAMGLIWALWYFLALPDVGPTCFRVCRPFDPRSAEKTRRCCLDLNEVPHIDSPDLWCFQVISLTT